MEYFNNYRQYYTYDKLYDVLNYDAYSEYVFMDVHNIWNKRVGITDRLAHFLKVKKGTRLSRSEINRAIIGYIRAYIIIDKDSDSILLLNRVFWIRKLNSVGRNLQNIHKKSYTRLDSALSHLFSTNEEQISYTQIHHYLAKHITK